MTHAHTIQGQPWQPCEACPRRTENGGDGSEGVCPSRRHIAYCQYATEAAKWARWLPEIRAQQPEDRPARNASKPPTSPATKPTEKPRPDFRRELAETRAGRTCVYREPCGCSSADCHWKGRKVSLHECSACQAEHVLTVAPT
jgi:hypothetical protein